MVIVMLVVGNGFTIAAAALKMSFKSLCETFEDCATRSEALEATIVTF